MGPRSNPRGSVYHRVLFRLTFVLFCFPCVIFTLVNRGESHMEITMRTLSVQPTCVWGKGGEQGDLHSSMHVDQLCKHMRHRAST